MTAEYESIFNEVDEWANEKRRQLELTQGPGVSPVRLNSQDFGEASTYLPGLTVEELASVEE